MSFRAAITSVIFNSTWGLVRITLVKSRTSSEHTPVMEWVGPHVQVPYRSVSLRNALVFTSACPAELVGTNHLAWVGMFATALGVGTANAFDAACCPSGGAEWILSTSSGIIGCGNRADTCSRKLSASGAGRCGPKSRSVTKGVSSSR